MTPRRSMHKARRQRIYDDWGGLCCLCHKPVSRHRFIVEHLHALVFDGPDSDENCGPAHYACANKKTNGTKATSYGSDSHAKAKQDRITGITKSQWTKTNRGRGRLGGKSERAELLGDPGGFVATGAGVVAPREHDDARGHYGSSRLSGFPPKRPWPKRPLTNPRFVKGVDGQMRVR